jgi:POT family proton-dependent oligopeptide transporter
MIFGLVAIGLCFAIMALAALAHPEGTLASPLWLCGCYLFMSVGELALSPVGLSLVTKLAPPRIAGLLMGVWFLGLWGGFTSGGWVGRLWPRMGHAAFFGLFVASSFAGALLFASLLPKMKRLTAGAE